MEIRIRTERDVYEPAADTELLVKSIRLRQGERVLEIGTGTGVIAIHCAKHGCHVTATDVVEEALELARENALQNTVDVDLRQGDMFEPVAGTFDVIIFNPPYLPTAPEDLTDSPLDTALDGGPDGTEVTVRFLEQLNEHLADEGRAYIVVSSLQDGSRIDQALLSQHLVARRRGSEKFDFETISVLEIRKPPSEARPGGAGAV
ncbi:MAG: methyltransferase [Thermoplasmata archaeon]|nr:MAG: methyltransferase [Thermoplasmata archaeon]